MKHYGIQLNGEYLGSYALYWGFYAVIASFSSAFLLGRGYTNSEIGIILAAANIASVFLQPLIADVADRSKRFDAITVAEISAIAMMVSCMGLLIFRRRSAALWVVYVMAYAWQLSLQPIMNSFSRKLKESGCSINFGLCRSGGSVGYSIVMVIMGSLVDKFGPETLPPAGLITLALLFSMFALMKKSFKTACAYNKSQSASAGRESSESAEFSEAAAPKAPAEEDAEDINLIEFIRSNGMFTLMNIFVVFLYFQNAVVNTFMFQIVTEAGGNSVDMGRILSIMAMIEVPVLLVFTKINARFSSAFLLKFGAANFALKILTMMMAKTVTGLYLAQFFHLFSFSLFFPAVVAFINEMMRKGEAVKGQALFTTATTISGIFASVFGGIILDASGAKMLLLVSFITAAIGMAGIIYTAGKIKKHA